MTQPVFADGYGIHRGVFTCDEMCALAGAIDAAPLTRSRAGARHVLAWEPVARLAGDTRLSGIASSWLESPAIPFKATLFEKSADANWLVAWHQDTALPLENRRDANGWGPWSEKYGVTYAHAPARALEGVIALRVHLDDSTADNGPLRVLPGTHLRGVLSDAQVHEISQRVAGIACHATRGDVVVMRPLIIHASSKSTNEDSRRVIHIEYAASLEVGPGLRLTSARTSP